MAGTRIGILTIILLVQAAEDQSQLLLMIAEVVHKLLKVQLSILVLVAGFHYFLLEGTREVNGCARKILIIRN